MDESGLSFELKSTQLFYRLMSVVGPWNHVPRRHGGTVVRRV